MFSKNEQGQRDVETIIGSSVNIEGNFVGRGDIIVEGKVTGSLKTSGNISVGENAELKAEVEGKNIVVAGKITGNVTASEKITLSSNAKVFGNIQTTSLQIDGGAVFQGKSVMSQMEHKTDTEKAGKTGVKGSHRD